MAPVLLFAFSALAIAYVIAGYPLLLGLLARTGSRPVRSAWNQPSVSAVVAVHNGELYIEAKLRSLLAVDYPRALLEILVVSDGSTDRTDALVQAFAPHGVRLLKIPRAGKCAALNAAFAETRGEILLLTDVRQPVEPESLQLLVNCFADQNVGAVSGELIIRRGSTLDEQETGLYWRYETWIRTQLSRIDSIFGATGPFYAIRRELAVRIPEDMLLDDMYLPLAAFFRGYRLIVESRARAFDYPTSRSSEFRRKIRTLAGNYQILRAYPQLLSPENRMWFHFLSYKIGRLALPWLFALALLSSFFLPFPWRIAAISAQAVFYGLAAADFTLPAESVLKRITSPAATFVTLMLAAVLALKVLVVPPRTLWKKTITAAESRSRQ
jgi:cellulose synthase/poly-beta-1,6-N-acetylglucosamine synthase-like glycosyltransferase